MKSKGTLSKRNKILKYLNSLLVLALILTSGILDPVVALANQSDQETLSQISHESSSGDESTLNSEIEVLSVEEQFDIRLLEIQPSNSFTLGGGETGEVIQEVTVNDQIYKVLIEKVSMPEFIGKTEQINGYYDIVVIGRNVPSKSNKVSRDYSGINLQGEEYDDGKGDISAGNNEMLPNGNYVENDITIKKAKELVEFINSNQLFVMNKDIFNISYADNSNLNKYFNTDLKDKTNVLAISSEEELKLSLNNIIEKYLSDDITKKINFTIKSEPVSDDFTANVGAIEHRRLKFNLTIPVSQEEMSVKLYLDMNGDGLFQEKEVYKTITTNSSQKDYELIYDIGTVFFGWIDWKIEVQKDSVKSYQLGHVYLKSLEEGSKKEIKVLQIKPNNGGVLDLATNEDFLKHISDIEYTISIESMTATDFNQKAGKTLKLNGKYDMVIIGFADNFGSSDISSDKALEELHSFIASGQSVMFTHDTMSLRMNQTQNSAYYLTKSFRDVIGQSRFLDKFNQDRRFTQDNTYIYTLDTYKVYNGGLYGDRNIPHINLSNKNNQIVGHALHGRRDIIYTSTVYQTNTGLITNYPYILSQTSDNNTNKTISVATTHNQWYQLNLEDPDVVPWFNLSHAELNDFDSRNNYYTYSKGNITYSGTGHSSGFTEDEYKLFVNTIIKAERGANHAPVISSSIGAPNSTQNIAGGKDASFTVTVTDQDGDDVEVQISAKVNGSEHELLEKTKYKQGELINVNVPSNLVGDNNKIEITVTARDIQGAEAEPVTYYLQASREPQLNVSNVTLNALVGDQMKVTINATKLFDSSNLIHDIKFELVKYNPNLLTVIEDNEQSDCENNLCKTYVINPKSSFTNAETIEGKVTYKVEDKLKETSFYIYVNSRAAEVSLKLVDQNNTLVNHLDVYVSLYGNETVKMDSAQYTFIGSERVRLLSNQAYSLEVNLPTTYELEKASVRELDINKKEVKKEVAEREQGILSIPTFNVSYDNPYVEIDLQVRTDLEGEIRILEIEPADKFKLSKTQGLDVTGTEIIYEKVDNDSDKEYKIIVDHITMPEFIGSVEKLNGKYDIIVIGRYVHDWSKSDPKNQKKYADYNFTRSDDYEENDITNRKAKEIIEFINSGQLVYLDKEILNNDISDTKLYRNFKEVLAPNLITSKSISELNLNEIISYYTTEFSDQNKRLKLQAIDATPSDITTNTDFPDGIAANRNRKMYIKTLSNITSSETYSLNLYLDLDGDGLFSADEITATKTGLTTSDHFFELDYSIHPDFIGRLEWKLEISKGNSESPIKTYVTGVMNFHRLPGKQKKTVRVLQINPNNYFQTANTDGDYEKDGKVLKYEVLDLSLNKKFQDLLSNSTELKDYDITVKIISAQQYNDLMENKDVEGISEEDKVGIQTLNGYYDMVILGFADSYGDKISQKGINNILSFLKTGQGLMLTHDTLTYINGKIEATQGRMLKAFRTLAGQARYSGLETDLNGTKIIYDPDQPKLTGNEEDKDLNVLRYSGATWAAIKNQQKLQSGNLATLSTEVYETNSALITSYPFNLVPDESSTLSIRQTHGQYLQLNLEDEAVIPWYTYTEINDPNKDNVGDKEYLNPNSVNPYDVRNNYYTYSRENITYSGTGEQKRERSEYPTSELKLFVNTIIKAERGANHAPTVEVRNLSEGMLISRYQENLNFTVIPTDMDLDQMKLTITVQGCKQNGCTSTDIGLVDEGYIRKNGESVSISLNVKDKLSNYETIKVTVKATDSHGADSKSVSYNLKITEDKLLAFSSNQVNYLIGDTATVNVAVNSNGTRAFNGEYEIKEVPSQLTSQSSLKHTFSLVDQKPSNLNFNFNVIGDSTVQVNSVSTINLLGEYTYCLGSDENNCANIEGSYESFINVKRGRITLKFDSNITELFLKHKIEVQLLRGDEIVAKQFINATNEVIFDTVPTGTYYIKFDSSDEVKNDYQVEKNSEIFSWDKNHKIEVNYENNHVIETFSINQVPFNLVHGLFKSQTNQEITILESTPSSLTTVDGETLVNFGATFTTKKNTNLVKLRVSEKFEDFSKDSIQIFKIERNSEKLSLKPLAGVEINKDSDINQLNSTIYNINLPNVSVGTEILIFYTALTPNEDLPLITNTITVGATMKDVSIHVEANDKDEEIPNSYLPDLF